MANVPVVRLTGEQYLAIERQALARSESNGKMAAMEASPTPRTSESVISEKGSWNLRNAAHEDVLPSLGVTIGELYEKIEGSE